MSRLRFFYLLLSGFLFLARPAQAQPLESPTPEVRVNVTLNPDGSRTTYQFDPANHKATATTMESDGKTMRGKIEYKIDELGRFASGEVYGPDNKFRFNSTYKYDASGHVLEETQSHKDGSVISKIVYSYDKSGKQTGYSVYDGSGKVIGQTTSVPTPTPKPRRVGH